MMNCLSVLSMFGVLCSFGRELDGYGFSREIEREGSRTGSISSLDTLCTATSSCTYTTISDDWISCRGYWACDYSTLIVSDALGCPGFYSCQYATISASSGYNPVMNFYGCWAARYASITGSLSTMGCTGEDSCTESVITSNNTYCDGYESCTNSNITASGTLYSRGSYALSGAIVTNTPYIEDGGYYTFNDALISSSGLDRLEIISRGEYSTSESTVLCYNGSTCIIRCQGDESCDGTILYCENGADCRIFCNACSSCPTRYNTSSIDDSILVPKLKNKRAKIIEKLESIQESNFKKEIETMQLSIGSSSSSTSSNNNKYSIEQFVSGKYGLLSLLLCIAFTFGIFVSFGVMFVTKYLCNNNKNKNNNNHQYQYQSI